MSYSSNIVQRGTNGVETRGNAVDFLHIGSIALENPAILAPLSGITDAPFRRQVSALGAGLVVSEMTACAALVRGKPEARLRLEAPGEATHVVQLAGCEAQWMAEGARIATDAGAEIIDINMGCPARHVTNGYSGSALMRDLDNALRLIEATIAATSVPVTLKMRLGWDDQTHNAAELARRAEAAGIAMVTVHGRTRCQFFAGDADWAAVRLVSDAVKIPVVINGDIDSYDSADTALGESGADAVMIGRGAQGRPWLPGFIGKYLITGKRSSDPPLAVQLRHLIELYDATLTHYGVRHGLRHARKHLSWGLNVAARVAGVAPQLLSDWRSKVLTAETPDAATGYLNDAYECFSWRSAA